MAIPPDETNNETGYLKGFYALRHSDWDSATGTGVMKIWDHNKGEDRDVTLPARMKVVNIGCLK